MVKTVLTGDQFSSEWCQPLVSTTITPFNQVIHHNDKVEPKKLSSFILGKLVAICHQALCFTTGHLDF